MIWKRRKQFKAILYVGVSQKRLRWEVCDLSSLLLAETVGTPVFDRDPACSLVFTGVPVCYCRCLAETEMLTVCFPALLTSEEGKALLAPAEKDAGKSKAAARLVLWPFCSFLASQSPVKAICILKFVV